MSRKSVGCCSYPPKLYHLVISKKELRFSYASEVKNNRWYCLWDTCCYLCCCCCCKNTVTQNERLFGPVKSSSIFSYDVKRVELETFDVLKRRKSDACKFYNWFTMFLWACWQLYTVIHLQQTWYFGILQSNTSGVGLVVLNHILPSFIILICPLIISACSQTRKKNKAIKLMK